MWQRQQDSPNSDCYEVNRVQCDRRTQGARGARCGTHLRVLIANRTNEKVHCLVDFLGSWWKEFELIRTVRNGGCFFKVETQFVSAVYNVKYLKMDCLVYGYIQYLHRAFCLVNFDFASR